MATAIAELLGFAVVVVLSTSVNQSESIHFHTALFLVGMVEGLILGFFQWLVLRRYIRQITGWIVATTIGALIAWSLGIVSSFFMTIVVVVSAEGMTKTDFLEGIALLGALVGSVLGFAQWLVLRIHIQRAAWWIVANAIAWSIGLLIAFAGAGMGTENFSLQASWVGVATGAAMGAVIGGTTGITLVWLLNRPLQNRR